ncbi:terminase gpA endonuclease subunit [Undibacterium sp. KW1]|uniref:terminase gpA endonuclease subunit n=1 Tax=Undibacterium sp. KW1 TaxID=2058624 RepID=UPI00351BE0D7
MQCLSPEHPCRRVVAKVASQLMKTQVALNWICGSIHQAPGNMLVLLPSLSLAKRVSGRIDKTINAVPVVNECVAAPRSRDSRNTIDTKEFKGGTDTAKDWIYNRIKFDSGPGAIHFSEDLSADYYEQMTAERKLTRYVKGFKRTEWVKAKAARNEAWDLMVYNLAAAHFLGLHRWREADWERKKLRVDPDQQDIFAPPVPKIATVEDQEEQQPVKPQARPRENPKVSAPRPTPTQQSPGQESGFVVYHSTDYE